MSTTNTDPYILPIEVPGIRAEDIEITMDSYSTAHRIKIVATKRGRTWSDAFLVPKRYDATQIKATLDLGVLTITLPYDTLSAPRKIPVLTSAPSGPAALA